MLKIVGFGSGAKDNMTLEASAAISSVATSSTVSFDAVSAVSSTTVSSTTVSSRFSFLSFMLSLMPSPPSVPQTVGSG